MTHELSKTVSSRAGSEAEAGRDRPRLHREARRTRPRQPADLEKYTQKLRELQYLLYAECKRSLLICLQALDAAGKDGTINHVLGNMNPQGTRVHGFKVPSKEEAAHDFLWRIHRQTPGKGEVVIFNRSHYEDVLVVRVHNLVARGGLVEALRPDQRVREGPGCQRHAHPQVLPAHQPGRTTPAVQTAARRSGAPLEDQRGDYAERELWPQYTAGV